MQALISKSTAYATPGCKVSTSSRVAVPSCNPPAVQRLPVQVSHGSRRTLVAVHAQASGSSQTQEARWENQVRDGTVKNCTTKQAGELMRNGWVLLDCRPASEHAKVGITGAVEVPLFLEDTSANISSLVKKATAMGMGGWWLGGTHMVPNDQFLQQVQGKVPKDAKVIVGCQKGLRSLAACEQLARVGYGQLAWINGGFDTAKPGDLPTTNGKDLRYAGIGGLSETLGWTEVQQEEGNQQGFISSPWNIIKVVAVFLLFDLLLFGYEQITYMTGQPNIFS
eukprot:jgi/Chrzof1/15233/Cz09g32120.t1